jgi:hypothetical protein
VRIRQSTINQEMDHPEATFFPFFFEKTALIYLLTSQFHVAQLNNYAKTFLIEQT